MSEKGENPEFLENLLLQLGFRVFTIGFFASDIGNDPYYSHYWMLTSIL